MSRTTPSGTWKLTLAALAACLALPSSVAAQGGPGFLFGEPDIMIGFKAGYSMPRAGSDLFFETATEFTIDRDDFRSASLGGEIAVRVSERWDVALGVAYAASRIQSEYEFWFEDDGSPDGIPIEQETWFRTVPVTVSGKYYFTDRGRSIGRFAWIPNRVSPFVIGGVGVVSYRFEQTGDFVNYETLDIAFDRASATGTAPYVHGGAGVQLSLSKNLVLTGEARYGWASGDLSRDFRGYENLDLAGLHLLAGIAARF